VADGKSFAAVRRIGMTILLAAKTVEGQTADDRLRDGRDRGVALKPTWMVRPALRLRRSRKRLSAGRPVRR